MIFTSDFGQLRPVRASSLFSHKLVSIIGPDVSQKEQGQTALHGASLWRQVDQVVVLKTNFRARFDPEYVNLLARIHIGRAWDGKNARAEDQVGNGKNYNSSDYDILNACKIQYLQ